MPAPTGSRAPVSTNWPIMSVPIWLTSGVSPPPMAVCSLATAWPQSTGVTLTVTPGLASMNLSAMTPSLVPSLPIAQTVSSPLSSVAAEDPAEAAGPPLASGAAGLEPAPSLVPHAVVARIRTVKSAMTRHEIREVSIFGASCRVRGSGRTRATSCRDASQGWWRPTPTRWHPALQRRCNSDRSADAPLGDERRRDSPCCGRMSRRSRTKEGGRGKRIDPGCDP